MKSRKQKNKKKTLTGEQGCSVWIAPLEFLRLTCCYLSGWRSNSHLWVKDEPQMTANFAMKKIILYNKLTDVLCLSCFQMQVELNLLCCSHLLEACLNFEGCQVQGVNYPWVCSHSAVCPNNIATNESIEVDLWLHHINRETKAFFKTIPEMKLNKDKWERTSCDLLLTEVSKKKFFLSPKEYAQLYCSTSHYFNKVIQEKICQYAIKTTGRQSQELNETVH